MKEQNNEILFQNQFYDCWPNKEPEIIEVNGIRLVNYGAGFVIEDTLDEIVLDGRTKIGTEYIDYNSNISYKPPVATLCPTINSGEKIQTTEVSAHIWVSDEHSDRFEILSPEDTISLDKLKEIIEVKSNNGIYLDSSYISVQDYQKMLGRDMSVPNNNSNEIMLTVAKNIIVYNTKFPQEINQKLISAFFDRIQVINETYYGDEEPNHSQFLDFVKYHKRDLIECLGGKEQLINFIVNVCGNEAELTHDAIEDINSYYPEIERTIKEATGEKEYLETIMGCAARKKTLEERSTTAKALLNEYEQNKNKNGHTQSDDE